MKKSLFSKALAVLIALTTLGVAACGEQPDTPTNYGELTVADVSVNYRGNATITPVFSIPECAEEITYTFEGSNIAINGNTVRGITPETTTVVTATTEHHSAQFNVNVVYANNFGAHVVTGEGNGVFKAIGEEMYVRNIAENTADEVYGVAYYYNGIDAVKGDMLVKGDAQMSAMAEGAYFDVVVTESATKAVRFQYALIGEGSYGLYSYTKDGAEWTNKTAVWTYTTDDTTDYSKIGFAVLVKEGIARFYFDGRYMGKTALTLGANAQIGVGVEKCTLNLENMKAYNAESNQYANYIEQASKVFGAHVYTGLASDNIFTEVEIGTEETGKKVWYQKSSTEYGRAFPYIDGLPVAGTNWSVRLRLNVSEMDNGAQIVFMVFKDEQNCVRMYLEKFWFFGDGLKFFSDAKINNEFKHWKSLSAAEDGSDWGIADLTNLGTDDAIVYELDVYISYKNGVVAARMHDTYGERTLAELDNFDLGNAQLAVGGEKCTFRITDLEFCEMAKPAETPADTPEA